MPEFTTLRIRVEDEIAILEFDRQRALNTITAVMVKELRAAFEYFETADEIRGVILTGAGNKSFIGGADLSEFVNMGSFELREFADYGQNYICSYIENFPKPVVAAVNGYALGGGSEIAMLCDIRIASKNAVFAQPEATIGIMTLYGATKRLQRLVGFGRAKEMIMTGRWVYADEALAIGLVSKVVEQEDLIPAAKEILFQIFKAAPRSVYFSKIAINRAADVDVESAAEIERDLAAILFNTEDKKEGLEAFLSKRKPEYKGR